MTPAPSATRRKGRLPALIVVLGVFTVCLIRLVGFVKAYAVNLLFDDQWDFLRPLFEGRGPWSCFFLQHGPHRLGLGGLIDWYMYRATDWDVRAEAWAAVVALTLTTILAIALAARLRGRLAWHDAAFSLLILSPIHWGTMTYTPSLAHSIVPLLLVMLLAWFWSTDRAAIRVPGVGICGALVLFTGYGICATPAVGGLALLQWLRPGPDSRVRRAAGLILLILGAAALIFAHGYHWDRATPGWRFPVPDWWDYPRFCALMFTSLLGIREISIASTVIGSVALILVLAGFTWSAVMVWRREPTPRAKAVWVLTGTSLVYSALAAFGRLPITLQAAFMWRYMTLMTPAFCGLALAVEGWIDMRRPRSRLAFAVAWLGLAGLVWSNFKPERDAAIVARDKTLWITDYLRTGNLRAANQASGVGVYAPAPDSPIIAARLRWLEQRHLSFFHSSTGKGSPAAMNAGGQGAPSGLAGKHPGH